MAEICSVEEQYAKYKKLKKDDVMNLMEWAKLQPHLPQISELQLIIFLHSCYYSNEAAKKCIDNYYTIRKMCPEFFANRNPQSDELKKCMKTIFCVPIPKLTPEGYQIYYSGLLDPNPDAYSFSSSLKFLDMTMSIRREQYGPAKGIIIILDLKNTSMLHVMKLNLVTIKKYMFYLQEALPVRIKGIHYVNAVPFMDKILALIKPFLKNELVDLLQAHPTPNDTIYKFIPKECLPEEVGGYCGSAIDLHTKYCNFLLKNISFFMKEEELVVDESKRPGEPQDEGKMFGLDGTFKKLDID